jgi:gliding motility-associated-like protein
MKHVLCVVLVLICCYSNSQNKFSISGDLFGQRVFVKNNGQFNKIVPSMSDVKFGYVNGDERVFFSKNQVTYFLQKHHQLSHRAKERMEEGKQVIDKPSDKYFVNVTWENSNPNVQIIESEKQSFYQSFGDANLKSDCYKVLTYKNVYNNIDVEYIFNGERENGIKYNIIVHPGGNVADVKIKYSGDIEKAILKDGNVIIKTNFLDVLEETPISYQNGKKLACNFALEKNTISFNLPNGYNNKTDLVIDPWVSNLSLTSNNYGYDVDYDYFGNYFVFGGSGPFLISKYTAAGALVWTFNGTVPSQGWTSLGTIPSSKYCGNFLVDKATSKCYTGEGFNNTVGTRIVRIDANGIYDNFISVGVSTWQECWDMGYECATGKVFGLGGSISNNTSAGILNTTSGVIAPTTFFAGAGAGSDIASHAIDPSGTVFFLYASGTILNNQIMRTNAAFNNNVWVQPSTYPVFAESNNKFYVGAGMPGNYSNGFNALAANANFLYYYNGLNLAAYNKTTGAKVGFTNVPGLTIMLQGGIAVDDCDNVYIGGNGNILCYNFNGTTFSPNGTIPLGATTPNKYVTDIKYYSGSNLLFVSGTGFGGTYSAINSTTCTIVQTSVTTLCSGNGVGSAITSVTTNIASPVVSYSYTNSSGVLVSQTNNSALLTNTATGLANGNYTVLTQINAPCGPINTQTFTILCVCNVTAVAGSSCTPSGITTSISLGATTGFTSTPTYSWSGPAGFTSTFTTQLVPNAASGIYTLQAFSPGCTGTGTVLVTVPSSFTPAISNTSISCAGGSNGTASVTTITGTSTAPYTYSWSTTPLQTGVQALNLTVGAYTCYVTDSKGCSYSATTAITQPPVMFLTLANSSVTCFNGANGTASVATVPIAGTSPYTYTWSTTPNQNSAVATTLTPGTYSCTLTDVIGCKFTGTTTVVQPPSVSLTVVSNTQQACAGNSLNLSATASGGSEVPYTYTWFNASTNPNLNVSENTGGVYTYSLTGFDVNMCPLIASKTVTFITNPILTSSNKSICEGQSANLNVNGALTYSWLPVTALSATIGSGVSASPSVTTVYNITGENNSCLGNTTVTVEVVPFPNVNISCAEQQICRGESTNIQASGANNYSWSPASSLSGTTGSFVTANPSITTNYTLIGYNTSGSVVCSVQMAMPIMVVPQVTPAISKNVIICQGEKAMLNASGGNTYVWTPTVSLNSNATSGVIANPTVNTTYTVHVSNLTFCGNSTTVSVIVNPNPTVTAGSDTTFNLDEEPKVITASGTGTLTWLQGENIFCSVCPQTRINPTRTGCYVIESINEFSCKAKDEVCVTLTTDYGVYIPNSFTPNGDGINDIFLVYGYSISNVKMAIFDRWGEELFSSTEQTLGWDGSYKGKISEIGVYVYKISYSGLDSKTISKTGHVTLSK